mgnify:FL=1
MEIKDRLSTNFGRLLAEVMHSMQSGTPKEQLIATMNIYEYHMKLKSRIAELEAKQRWIPVSERLPEEFTLVLTIGKDNLPVAAVVDRGHWYSSFEYSLNVTHWMPLPEPPEDNSHEPA